MNGWHTNWVGNLIGLVVAVLAATMLAPLFPSPADAVVSAVCWIAGVVFLILLLVALWRRFGAPRP